MEGQGFLVSCAGQALVVDAPLSHAMAQADLAAWTWGHVAIVAKPNGSGGWRLVYSVRPPPERATQPLPEGVREASTGFPQGGGSNHGA